MTTLRSLIFILLLALSLRTDMHAAFADKGTKSAVQQVPDGFRVYGYLWNDTNCDGIRQSTEGVMPPSPSGAYRMSLIYIGNDGIPFTTDDNEIDNATSANGNIHYGTMEGGGGNTYYIAFRPAYIPAGFTPSLFQQGSDPTLDNDMKVWERNIWATTSFVIKAEVVTGIDIGLCPVENLNLPYSVLLPMALR